MNDVEPADLRSDPAYQPSAGSAAQATHLDRDLALAVRLQPSGKSLTDAEIEAVSAKIVDKVTKATGGSLRS